MLQATACACAGASEQEQESLHRLFTTVFQRLVKPMDTEAIKRCFFFECEEAVDAVAEIDPIRVREETCSRDIERGRRQAITNIVLTPNREAWWPQASRR